MDVFLCGALGDRGLASLVLDCDPAAFRDVELAGYSTRAAPNGDLSSVVADASGTVPGLLVQAVGQASFARLSYVFEVFGLTPGQVDLNGAAVQAAVATGPGEKPNAPDLVALREVLAEMLAHRHSYSPAEMAARLMPIRMRAAQWSAAQAQAAGADHDPQRDVIVHARHRPYMNFYAMQEMDLQFRKQDGTMSDVINRGALMLGAAAVVLPYDPVRDQVLLIEQFRAPLFIGGCQNPWTWEPVAGLVDPGETAVQTAHREAMEEAGLTLRHLELVGPAYSSTGAVSDHLSLFVGLCDLSRLTAASGLASEGEDIRSQVMPFDDLLDGIDAQRYPDLPLIAIALWLARHRDRMRAMT